MNLVLLLEKSIIIIVIYTEFFRFFSIDVYCLLVNLFNDVLHLFFLLKILMMDLRQYH